MKIILLNGPAGSGKDTIADMLVQKFEGRAIKKKFAQYIKDSLAKIMFDDYAEFAHFDKPENKDLPWPEFGGHTPREAQIRFSQNFVKPILGQKFFGSYLAQKIKEQEEVHKYDYYVISDSGFREEAIALLESFGFDSLVLFRIYRTGKTFNGDSRNYVKLFDYNVKTVNIMNSENQVNQAVEQIYQIVKEFENNT